MNTAIVYKWRITNAKYIYITDEEYKGPFIYDMTDDKRVYSEDTTYNRKVDEVLIKRNASMFDEEQYKEAFKLLKFLLNNDPDGYYLHLLDYTAYLKDIPECSESATDVTCDPIDIMLTADAKTLSPGENAVVVIDNTEDETLPDGGRMRIFNLSFGIPAGSNGKSAYEIAKEHGYTGGDEKAWIDSLKGEKGEKGEPGQDGIGTAGKNGKSAYQIAVDNGYTGSTEEWLNSLKGDKGDPGTIGIDKVEKETSYNILGYNTASKDSNISYFPYVYNKFISNTADGEGEQKNSFYLSSAGEDIYDYKRTYHLNVEFLNSVFDCIVNPIENKFIEIDESIALCLCYINNNGERMIFYDARENQVFYAISGDTRTDDSFKKLYHIYEIAKNGKYEENETIETYTSDNNNINVYNAANILTSLQIVKLSVEVEKTLLKTLKSDFIVNSFDKISIKPESELSSNIQLNSDANEKIPIKYSNITQKLDNTRIEHYLLKSEEYVDNRYKSIMEFKAKSLNIDLLKNNQNVCDIIIGNDNFEINQDQKRKTSFKVTSNLSTFKTEVKARVNNISDVYLGVPIGTIVMWPLETAPKGWLICDGKEYNRNDLQYYELYKVIGTKYNYNSISNINGFRVPNLKQRFPLGADQIVGATGGTKEVTLTTSQMPKHNHNITAIGGYNDTTGNTYKTFSVKETQSTETGNRTVDVKVLDMEEVGESKPHNNMPPYLTLNFIIKYM